MKGNAKHLVILAGANGVGKTTLASELLKEFKLKLLNADEIAKFISPQQTDLTKVRIKAGKLLLSQLNSLIKQNKSFALESTLSGKYLVKVINSMKNKRYKIELLRNNFLGSKTLKICSKTKVFMPIFLFRNNSNIYHLSICR